jgi:hypothetical protein
MPRDDPDMNGVSHTVEITAAAFYEAVAPCLAATNRLPEFPRGSNAVKVSVADVRVEHEVKTMDFTKWFEETDGSPREVSNCLNSIDPRPPLLYPATTMKAKSCGPDSGREEVRSQRVPLWNLTGVWNWAVRKIELDARTKYIMTRKTSRTCWRTTARRWRYPVIHCRAYFHKHIGMAILFGPHLQAKQRFHSRR